MSYHLQSTAVSRCTLDLLHMAFKEVPTINVVAVAVVLTTRNTKETDILSFLLLQAFLAFSLFCSRPTRWIFCNVKFHKVVCPTICILESPNNRLVRVDGWSH